MSLDTHMANANHWIQSVFAMCTHANNRDMSKNMYVNHKYDKLTYFDGRIQALKAFKKYTTEMQYV